MHKRINVGCGFSTGASWENYDASPTLRFERLPVIGRLYTKNASRFPAAVRYGDITRGPLCAPGEAEAVYCSHMLEHVPLEDMRRTLVHILTMLAPGGVFRLIVPDLGNYVARYTDASDPERAHRLMRETLLGKVSAPAGMTGRVKQALGLSTHLWMYDEASMRLELERAGFADIRRCHFGDADNPVFAEVEEAIRFEDDNGPNLGMQAIKGH